MAKILSERVSMGGYVDFHCCYRQQHYRSVDIRKRAESILLDAIVCIVHTSSRSRKHYKNRAGEKKVSAVKVS